MERTLAEIDVYLAPITSSRSRNPGSVLNLNTSLTNLTGHPGIVVRNGLNAEGRPTSVTFIGKIYGEAQMLALAHAYQTATDWHLKHPDLTSVG
jgi:Asp-tRNA(Asn)/Glu-tRNA(Gln) amidotransferase A subunit family amidase